MGVGWDEVWGLRWGRSPCWVRMTDGAQGGGFPAAADLFTLDWTISWTAG